MNKVILVGRLGAKPELRSTPGGSQVATLSVATSESWVDQNQQRQNRTEWHRVIAWGKLAKLCSDYLDKGREIYVEGRIQTRQWQDKEGHTRYSTEVVAQTIQFLGGRSATSGAGTMSSHQDEGYGSSSSSGMGSHSQAGGPSLLEEPSFAEEDIPF